jgi:chromosome segregation ATPase
MSKWKWIPKFVVIVTFLLTPIGCEDIEKQKALAEAEQLKEQLAKLQITLEKTQSEKDALQSTATKLSKSLQKAESELAEANHTRDSLQNRISEITTSRDELRKKLVQLIESHDNLKQQVDELTTLRDELQQKVDTLSEARDGLQKRISELTRSLEVAAPADARDAHTQVLELTTRLQRHVQDMAELNDRVKMLQSSFVQLKKRLEQVTASPTG